MSDFIFSNQPIQEGKLAKNLASIYHENSPKIHEYHGMWGSLAVSENLYYGYQPYESNEHICVVLGGPLLYFSDVSFIKEKSDRTSGTKAIYKRWLSGEMNWDEDLSGPFAICIINKQSHEALFVTDLMSFIPLYQYKDIDNVVISSHSDALAKSTNQVNKIDIVSRIDFILHGVITYPYTVYKNIQQMAPASEHHFISNKNEIVQKSYWQPIEKPYPHSISQAAKDLRKAITTDINKVISQTKNIAQFISGGEDSRTISSLLSSIPNRDAFIFLDQMNREGKVAEKAAKAYGAKFRLSTRDRLHYLNIIPDCSDLIGEGAQYFHAHTFGFHKKCNLEQYDAVFGGLFSDALLKGARIKKVRGSTRFPFIPQIKNTMYSPAKLIKNDLIKEAILGELNYRRKAHYEYVKSIRPTTAEEWFELWPSSMNMNIPNLHANRRLFRSYEPFMSKEIVKISAIVPQKWKMNRRLFHKFAKPYLKQTKWLLHSEGKLPYASWYINVPILFFFWVGQEIGKKIGLIKGNQGPWASWDTLLNSKEWLELLQKYSHMETKVLDGILVDDIHTFYNSNRLT
jgi:asparagine synthetase B (glutamine-hydrolysing)